MPTIVTDCPHCPAKSSAFAVVGMFAHPIKGYEFNFFAICPACGDGIGGRLQSQTGQDPLKHPGNLLTAQGFRLMKLYPVHQMNNAPEHMPPRAEKAFLEGVASLDDGRYTAAGVMFRRSLEISLHELGQTSGGNLKKRIDALAEAVRITPDLKDLAHRVRLDGNEAVHDDDDFSKEQATQLEEFTRLLMIYLFTLPAKVKQTLDEPGGA